MKTEAEKANDTSVEIIAAYNRIPYALINKEIDGSASDVLAEFTQIVKYYGIYNKGSKFTTEGTSGDYVPAQLRYKLAASLINKEARFLFAEKPDIIINPKGDLGKTTQEAKDNLTIIQDLVDTVLKKNKFEKILIQAAKDCFIGKRVAGVVNFNEKSGITLSFLSSLNFIYETKIDNPETLTKFVSFTVVRERMQLSDRRIFKKKFQLVTEADGSEVCYLEEGLYDGRGALLEQITENQPTLMNRIPVAIFSNDGLTGDLDGESEIKLLDDFESYYSKLNNADIDSERKTMNPIRYTVDMDAGSTKDLKSSAGSYWDLTSDQNLDSKNPQVGMLTSSMEYSVALGETLKRMKASMYDQIDMPDIESMQATITSGKALKAIYWPLIVRCKEKMTTWGPQLEYLIDTIIQGAMVYPNCITLYTDDMVTPVAYEINIDSNYPLPEDEIEEKTMDMTEVNGLTMSKKAYMKKWRGLTDEEAEEELKQMALEVQMMESTGFEGITGDPQDNVDNNNDINNLDDNGNAQNKQEQGSDITDNVVTK